MRYLWRLGLAVVASLALALITSGAWGHNVLIDSSPEDGATLSVAPDSVSFTFNDKISEVNPTLVVVGPNGNNFAGAPVLDYNTISAEFAAGPAGEYHASFRIVSADGHPVSGELTFTLEPDAAGDATGEPIGDQADATAAETSSSTPWVWIIAGVLAVIGVVLILFTRSTRRR